MKTLSKLLSVIVGLTVMNVWIFRSDKSTLFRGGDANNLIEEFEVYGLGEYFLIIGIIKVGLAVLLILSLYFTKVRFFAASGIAVMMLVAIFMHINVGDELIKSVPASILLLSSLIIAYAEKISSK
jgi:hypothetical protein|tara:strand:- start:125 stop:502 length:378 start_codon:yes stop_codon:yes gene_type:complete